MAVTTTYTRFKEMFMIAHTNVFNKKGMKVVEQNRPL